MIQLTYLKTKFYSPKNWKRTESNESNDTKILHHTKIHKENNPGRTVSYSISCHTSEILRFVDYHRQLLAKEIPSHIKDINYFVNKINNFKVSENSFLITMDVKALYTNI